MAEEKRFRRRSLLLNSFMDKPDLVRRTPPQLQSPDLGSPRKVWSLMCGKEELSRSVSSNLFASHPKLNSKMREILIEWLMEVCADKKLHRETFHLCVDYIDAYLCKTRGLEAKKLQLIATTALVIATKMEEIYPPNISEIAEYTDGYCTDEEINSMEEAMLQTLEWNMIPVTAVHWLSLYLQLLGDTHSSCVEEESPQAKRGCQRLLKAALQVSKEAKRYQSSEQKTPDSGIQLSMDSSAFSISGDIADVPTSTNESFELFEGEGEEEEAEVYCLNRSYSDGHLYPSAFGGISTPAVTVPRFMRDEFVRLATVLDLTLLDARSRNFKYSELAAALLMFSFEPNSLVEEVTGFTSTELSECCRFIEPFTSVCDELSPTGVFIPTFNGNDVLIEDRHNIQPCIANVLGNLEKAQEMLEADKENLESVAYSETARENSSRGSSVMANRRKRKRSKFGSKNNLD